MTPRATSAIIVSLLFLTIIVLMFAFFVPKQGLITSFFNSQPETFTELYFTDHLKLPPLIKPDVPATVSASIHNLEGKQVNYKLEVSIVDDDQPHKTAQLFSQEIPVNNTETMMIPIELRVPSTASFSGKVKITFNVKNIDQSIYFWSEMPWLPEDTITQPSISN